MKRRTLILALGGAVTLPPTGRAQQKAIPHIVYLWLGSAGSDTTDLKGLRAGLRDLGYVEGRNIVVDYRYADGNFERLAEIAAAAIATKPNVIFTAGDTPVRTVLRLTQTIPIVAVTGDQVAAGFAASLAKPGGNITGMTVAAGPELAEKWLEIVIETVPAARRIAVLRTSGDALTVKGLERIRFVRRSMVSIAMLASMERRAIQVDAASSLHWPAKVSACVSLLLNEQRHLFGGANGQHGRC